MNDSVIQAAEAYLRTLFQNNSDGHDLSHSLRVYENAMRIAATEPACDLTVVALAALLHDADDHKLFATQDQANARRFLASQAVPEVQTSQILRAIASVSFSQNPGRRPDTLEGQIVQDADRLDAIGAVGIARTFAYGGAHGRSLASSIAHFHEKLLLLQDTMNTAAGRELARTRHAFLETFLEEYKQETARE